MEIPADLTPLVDGDILRFEIGYGAETGWRGVTEGEEAIPPWSWVEAMLHSRLTNICRAVSTTVKPRIFLTEGHTFRHDIATTKPYKGTRISKKPWHYENLTVYMRDVLGAEIVTHIETDDKLAIEQVSSNNTTIICTRDKDLRQVPGWLYSWELGKQAAFGPTFIENPGTIELVNGKIKATGLLSFYAQLLTGDTVDNIPGLPGCGPVGAYEILTSEEPEYYTYNLIERIENEYYKYNGEGYSDFVPHLLEQGRLVWMTRKLHPDGTPVLWEIGMEE